MPELRSGSPLFCTGPHGEITEWNAAAERLTGVARSDALGRCCWDVLGAHGPEGELVCHPGCSTGRLAREGWPVRSLDIVLRTAEGAKRVTLSTIVFRSGETPTVVHTMHEVPTAVTPAVDAGGNGHAATLTPRQREILLLLARGVRAKEIALRLRLSETTVRNHIQAILLALGVHSQLEAVARARAFVDDGPVA